MDRYETLKQQLQLACPSLTLLEWEPMSRHTSFQIGGPVRLMALPASGGGADCGASGRPGKRG